jgi:hypothetical protein
MPPTSTSLIQGCCWTAIAAAGLFRMSACEHTWCSSQAQEPELQQLCPYMFSYGACTPQKAVHGSAHLCIRQGTGRNTSKQCVASEVQQHANFVACP